MILRKSIENTEHIICVVVAVVRFRVGSDRGGGGTHANDESDKDVGIVKVLADVRVAQDGLERRVAIAVGVRNGREQELHHLPHKVKGHQERVLRSHTDRQDVWIA